LQRKRRANKSLGRIWQSAPAPLPATQSISLAARPRLDDLHSFAIRSSSALIYARSASATSVSWTTSPEGNTPAGKSTRL
jgi:hypothetical protein